MFQFDCNLIDCLTMHKYSEWEGRQSFRVSCSLSLSVKYQPELVSTELSQSL